MKITRRQLKRVIKENFEATAQAEAEKINRQTDVGLVTDQAFWARAGIHTGEELAKSVISQTYSDYYKDINGRRPRGRITPDMSVEDIQGLIDELDEQASDEWYEERHMLDQELGWEDDMMSAVKNNPQDIPSKWIEYDKSPSRQGMGRRPGGKADRLRMESNMKITRQQLRRIIREAIDPREMEEPLGGWAGNALTNDPDYKHHTDTPRPAQEPMTPDYVHNSLKSVQSFGPGKGLSRMQMTMDAIASGDFMAAVNHIEDALWVDDPPAGAEEELAKLLASAQSENDVATISAEWGTRHFRT